jgi:hypothetical protein
MPVLVAVPPLGLELPAGIKQVHEELTIQQLVPQPPVEALDEGVLDWPARPNELQLRLPVVRPRVHRLRVELDPVVNGDRLRIAALGGDGVEELGDPLSRQRGVRREERALARKGVGRRASWRPVTVRPSAC